MEARFSDCAAVDCFRGGITVTGGHSVVQVSNFVGQGETHRSGLQWEIDGAGFGGSFANESTVDGAVIEGDFDLGLAPGSKALVDNVICRRPLFYVYAPGSKVSVSNCSFAVGQQTGFDNRVVHPGDVTFANCSFTVTEAAEREEADRSFAALDVFWNTADTAHQGQRLRLIDCRFDVAPGVDAGDTTYAVYTRPDAPSNDNRLIVDGGEVSAAYDSGVHVSQGGRVIRVDSPPQGRVAGLVGDRAQLQAPAAGQPYEWVCTSAGLAAAAKWELVSSVAP